MAADAPPSAHRPGIFAWFGYRMPLPELFRLVRAAGFRSVSLWWDPAPTRCATVHGMPALARDAGLYVESAHVPFSRSNALWAADPAVRQPVLEEYLAWLGDCAVHRIPRLVMHVVSGHGPEAPTETGMDSFRQLVRAAEARGVTLALENTRRPDLLSALLAAFPSPRLGLCYDISHDRLWPAEAPGLLWRHGDRLATVHLSDTDGRLDRHWLPGDGVVDWPAFAAALPRGYAGPLMLEVMPYKTPALSAEAFLAEASQRAGRLDALIREHT
ncbi:MAG TPA: sugar phosphate isomerase/epimerase family protein [Armatimonadota bacterium]|nr:sugar phosphate isomerase/epimerase family protein [Armatimonadota bacterium]